MRDDPKCTTWDIDPQHQAIADQIAKEWLPDTGPCRVCGDTVTGARHRVADAIVAFMVTKLADTE